MYIQMHVVLFKVVPLGINRLIYLSIHLLWLCCYCSEYFWNADFGAAFRASLWTTQLKVTLLSNIFQKVMQSIYISYTTYIIYKPNSFDKSKYSHIIIKDFSQTTPWVFSQARFKTTSSLSTQPCLPEDMFSWKVLTIICFKKVDWTYFNNVS